MTVIYEPMVRTGYEWVNLCDPEEYRVFSSFDGTCRAPSWRPLRVRTVAADERQACKQSDFPWLGTDVLILRPRAVDALGEMVRTHGELLPLQGEDGSVLFALNVTRVLDALDAKHSDVLKVPGTTRIMRIKKPVFRAEIVRDVDIFRLPHRVSSTYLSERFVQAVKRAGLEGLEFKLVWKGSN